MSKKLISFRDKQRRRRQSRSRHPKNSGRPHEWDDLVLYWRRMLAHPLQLSGRQVWTERMLWSNALGAGILRAIALTIFSGFHFLLILTAVINTLFLAFLFYYGMTWVIDWVMGRSANTRQRYAVTDLRTEMIVLSGLIVPYVVLTSLLGFLGMAISLSILIVGVLRATQHVYRATWSQVILSTGAGILSMLAVMYILNAISAL